MVKSLPAMQETQVWSLGQEDLLEEEMATHSNSCLGNPMGRGAWWATVHGVTRSQTWMNVWNTHPHVYFLWGKRGNNIRKKIELHNEDEWFQVTPGPPRPIASIGFYFRWGQGCAPRPGLSDHGWSLECDFLKCIYNPGTYKGWNPIFDMELLTKSFQQFVKK